MALDEATLGQLRETVRRFVSERLIPLEAQSKSRTFPLVFTTSRDTDPP